MTPKEKETFQESFQVVSMLREKLLQLYCSENVLIQEIIGDDLKILGQLQQKYSRLSL